MAGLCACSGNKDNDENSEKEQPNYNGFTYELLDDGNAEITGYILDTANENIKMPDTITIDSTEVKVTSIAAEAFKDNQYLKYVTLPVYIEKIGDNAFANSTIENAIMVSSRELKSIGAGAFKGCKNLVQLDIPENIENIGEGAFADTPALVVVTFRGNTKGLTKSMFENSNSFTISTYEGNSEVLKFAEDNNYNTQILTKG